MEKAPAHFFTLWHNACHEMVPDPNGAAGALMESLGKRMGTPTVTYEQIGSAALFLMDLSLLGLRGRGMDLNVVMVTHTPVDDADAREQARLISEYKDAVKSVGFCFHLLLQSDPPPRNPYISSYVEQVLLYKDDIERLFASEFPASALFAVIRSQVKIQHLCPFATSREARGSMFRGRKWEWNRLVDDLDVNFILTGARLIGKTSLLMKAADTLRVQRTMSDRVHYFDCSNWGDVWDCAHRLAHAINVRKELRIEASVRNVSYMLQEQSHNGRHPLLLFLDEFDSLVEQEMDTHWPFTRILHEAATHNWVRLTFAGFRSVQQLFLHKLSPFYGSLECLTLKPLSAGETEGLLCDPFHSLNFVLSDRENIVSRVYRNTAGHPFLAQFYGERLFQRAIEADTQEIVINDVAAVEDSFELHDFLINHFLVNTLDGAVPALDERVCAFAYAHSSAQQGWSEQDFLHACQQYHLHCTPDQIHKALANLYYARVFSYEHGRYTFTFPLLRTLLQNHYTRLNLLTQAQRRS